MKLNNEKQIFNLMDTNGRRNDIINALQGYLSILSDLNGEWDNLPNSLSQYLFYMIKLRSQCINNFFWSEFYENCRIRWTVI